MGATPPASGRPACVALFCRSRWSEGHARNRCGRSRPLFTPSGRVYLRGQAPPRQGRQDNFGSTEDSEEVAQGLRALTIRKRIRDWLKARTFFQVADAMPWPEHAGIVIEYIHAITEKEASKSAAWDFMEALVFLERRGGVRPESALHLDPSIRVAVAEARVAPTLKGQMDRKVAPPYLVAMVEAMERLVADESEQRYPRMLAWWKLLKIYGTLRFDDHRGLTPSSFSLTSAAVSGSPRLRQDLGHGQCLRGHADAHLDLGHTIRE
jgi:hypothetical protein